MVFKLLLLINELRLVFPLVKFHPSAFWSLLLVSKISASSHGLKTVWTRPLRLIIWDIGYLPCSCLGVWIRCAGESL